MIRSLQSKRYLWPLVVVTVVLLLQMHFFFKDAHFLSVLQDAFLFLYLLIWTHEYMCVGVCLFAPVGI